MKGVVRFPTRTEILLFGSEVRLDPFVTRTSEGEGTLKSRIWIDRYLSIKGSACKIGHCFWINPENPKEGICIQQRLVYMSHSQSQSKTLLQRYFRARDI